MRVDCHCDTALALLTECSLRRLPGWQLDLQRAGRYLDLAVMAIFIDERRYASAMAAQFQKVLSLLRADIDRQNDLVTPLLWREQLGKTDQRTLLLIGAEGAEPIGADGGMLEQFYREGLRLLGLTWNGANSYAGGCASGEGLTAAGQKLVQRCNSIGILIDGAHLNRRSFWQLLECSSQPVIVSHTACDALHHHRRNLDDEQMRALADHGGVMGIAFVPDFLGGAGDLLRLCEHIEHAVTVMGSSHVALGSDFDGCKPVAELGDISQLPRLYAALAERGMAEEDLAQIIGGSAADLLQKILPPEPAL